jgi:murein DD-endopeptidase MepM/ murein hydrolase activator NlpD
MGPKPHKHDFWEDLFAESLPRTHMLAAGCLATLIIAFLVFGPSGNVSAYREATLTPAVSKAKLAALLVDPTPRNSAPLFVELNAEVRKGDNLSTIFSRLSLSPADTYAVANAVSFADEFRKIQPGEIISVRLDDEKQIQEVLYKRSLTESFQYRNIDGAYKGKKLERIPETVSRFTEVEITHSLFKDGVDAGLTHAQIMQIANIFGWDIDFALDLQPGDNFSVLLEDQYIDGEKIGSGNILSTSFTNGGTTYEAVRYVTRDGDADYYTPDGKPMRKAFLRAPLDFTRVSSNFNPNRLHPILKTKRPHRGVDYAAPTGTPVYAAGNGKVIKTGYTPANGNYVFVKHGNTYTTKYLHLSKISVKRGQTVKQRQIVGAVGSTGYATGPHLHYEFLVNGVHTNPRTVALPQADPIGKQELARFKSQTGPLLAQLKNPNRTQLAALRP